MISYVHIIKYLEQPLKRYTKAYTKNTIDESKWNSIRCPITHRKAGNRKHKTEKTENKIKMHT